MIGIRANSAVAVIYIVLVRFGAILLWGRISTICNLVVLIVFTMVPLAFAPRGGTAGRLEGLEPLFHALSFSSAMTQIRGK